MRRAACFPQGYPSGGLRGLATEGIKGSVGGRARPLFTGGAIATTCANLLRTTWDKPAANWCEMACPHPQQGRHNGPGATLPSLRLPGKCQSWSNLSRASRQPPSKSGVWSGMGFPPTHKNISKPHLSGLPGQRSSENKNLLDVGKGEQLNLSR